MPKKEENNMLAYRKPTPSTMIMRGMTQAFIDELSKNKIDKGYRDECEKTKREISPSIMDEIKKISSGN